MMKSRRDLAERCETPTQFWLEEVKGKVYVGDLGVEGRQ